MVLAGKKHAPATPPGPAGSRVKRADARQSSSAFSTRSGDVRNGADVHHILQNQVKAFAARQVTDGSPGLARCWMAANSSVRRWPFTAEFQLLGLKVAVQCLQLRARLVRRSASESCRRPAFPASSRAWRRQLSASSASRGANSAFRRCCFHRRHLAIDPLIIDVAQGCSSAMAGAANPSIASTKAAMPPQ